MSHEWYVLRSKPHKEHIVRQQLLKQGIDVFYPAIATQPAHARTRTTAPYFPGYMFVYCSLDAVGLSTFRWMPCAYGLICFDDIPASVPGGLIDAIRTHVEGIATDTSARVHQWRHGETVVIWSGPFAGYEALFDQRLPGKNRVRVLLELLSDRRVPIALGLDQLAHKR